MRKYLVIIAIVLIPYIVPNHAFASIARDNSTSFVSTCVTSLTCTLNLTVSGSDRYLVTYVLDNNNTVTGVTYNGVSMSLIQSTSTNNGSERLKAYGLIAPATGANDVVVTSSAANTILLGAISYTGASQISQPDNSTNNSFVSVSSPSSTTITTSADNSWTVLFGRTLTTATFAGTGSTFIGSDSGSDGRNVGLYDSNGPISPSGGTSMGLTWSGTNSGTTIMFSIAPVPPAPVYLTGSGTSGKLAKFTSGTSLGNSLFSDDGTNTTLTSGNLFLGINALIDTVSNGALSFGTTQASTLTFGRAGQNMIINSKVGIGTSTPTAMLHVNGDFFANLVNIMANGQGIDTLSAGSLSIGSTTATSVTIGRTGITTTVPGIMKVGALATVSNCASSATPAICGSATAGSVSMATGVSTLTINTTAVTANSQILITEDSSLGTRLGITCNTTTGRTYSISARTAGSSFTIKSSANPTTNKACLSYAIIN